MPHVSIKLWPGRTDEQKKALTHDVIVAVKKHLGASDDYISVAFEEISSERWPKEVYKPEIIDKKDLLYKEPGYSYTPDDLA